MSPSPTLEELIFQGRLLRENSVPLEEWLLNHLNGTVIPKFSLKDWVKGHDKSNRSR